MKKLLALFLAFALMLSLTACIEDTSPDNSTGSNLSQTENNNDNTDNTENTQKENNTPVNDKNAFSEVVVVDNTECSIKITKIEPDNMWGYTLKANLENKSADKTYMFSVENAAINGVVCDPFFAAEVAAGKKSNNDINFSLDELEENGIGDITDIELSFRVYDSEDWSADAVAEETVHIYPFGEEKAVPFVRKAQPSDNVIIDNDYVSVIVTGYEEDALWGYTVNLFLTNKTDKNVMFSVDDASVNGYMADPFYATSVAAGKCAFSSISWSDTALEDNGITAVEEIEFVFRAYDESDWLGDDFANETITLNP